MKRNEIKTAEADLMRFFHWYSLENLNIQSISQKLLRSAGLFFSILVNNNNTKDDCTYKQYQQNYGYFIHFLSPLMISPER